MSFVLKSSGQPYFIKFFTLALLLGCLQFGHRSYSQDLITLPQNNFNNLLSLPDTIYLNIPKTSWHKLKEKRKQALKRGLLLASKKDFTAATLVAKNDSTRVKIRLKGDWNDHIMNKNWSFRIHVIDSTWYGMSRLNIQAPRTRHWLFQWLFFEAAQKENLLVPRTDYLTVFINKKPYVYLLEEHMELQLPLSQNRQKGPIMRYNEDGPWKGIANGIKWTPENDDEYFLTSKIDDFQSAKVRKNVELKAMFKESQRLLAGFRDGSLKSSEVFDVRAMSRFLAVSNLFGGAHGYRWHNLRFYYNPKLQKLEPICPRGT